VPASPASSPVEALRAAFYDTLRLLFVPFLPGRWIRLCLIGLFLGGGTSTAAFHWSLSSLPSDFGLGWRLESFQMFLAENAWLLGVMVLVALAVGLSLLYIRALCRFALVDTILERRAALRMAARKHRALTRSYFRWLLGILVTMGLSFSTVVLLVRPYLSTTETSLTTSLLVAALLAGTVLAGLLLAGFAALTDDLAVPVMVAERLPLAAAWRRLLGLARAEPISFVLYLLLRFVVAIGAGVAALLFLFPTLLTLFSGAMITSTLTVISLRFWGVEWVWNPATLLLAVLALLMLSTLILALLSLAGMPGVVLLQTFGIRFVSPRIPTLRMLSESASQDGS
jgi:hypothetical protein